MCFEEFSEENLKVGLPKRKVVSQPPFSRGDVSFKELVVFGIPRVFLVPLIVQGILFYPESCPNYIKLSHL